MANNTRQIRRQIKSIKNTAKITKAMEMISAVKMQRTQTQALSARPYADSAWEILTMLSQGVKKSDHPFFEQREIRSVGIVVLSSNRGLCGGLNSSVAKEVLSVYDRIATTQRHASVKLVTMGKRARDTLARMNKEIAADFPKPDVAAGSSSVVGLAQFVLSAFLNKEFDHVVIVYPKFLSILRQEAAVKQLLPLREQDVLEANGAKHEMEQKLNTSYLFEPSTEEVLRSLLERLMEVQVYQALLETNASEHAARMVAMKNATENALEIVGDLTLFSNRVRQAAITQEVSEITSGRLALEG